MDHKHNIHDHFDAMSRVMADFIKQSEQKFPGGWVSATFVKNELELKKNAYPQGNKTDNKTGWLFSTMARYLQDKGVVDYKKINNRAFYKSK